MFSIFPISQNFKKANFKKDPLFQKMFFPLKEVSKNLMPDKVKNGLDSDPKSTLAEVDFQSQSRPCRDGKISI